MPLKTWISLSMKPRTLPAPVMATGPSNMVAAVFAPITDERKEKPAPTTRPLAVDRRLIFADVGCLSRHSFAAIGRFMGSIEGS
jgi:hypothetical protein